MLKLMTTEHCFIKTKLYLNKKNPEIFRDFFCLGNYVIFLSQSTIKSFLHNLG
jgi:hypothetical protein